ncbi:MAG: NAD(P)H-dependent oxidoreductase subunit E, partial [Clostridia bacterium]|nr:NAD(P)H-dependent oxidoreductase subunit E [Clostridia bacterium]
MDLIRSHVMVCGGTGCTSSNSAAVIAEFEKLLVEKGLDKEVKVVRTGCFGLCEAGPVCIVYPEGAFYAHVTTDDVAKIVDEHLIKGRIVKELLYKGATEKGQETIKSLDKVDFYKKQKRVALRNCGVIDPENIEEYIA